MAKKIELSIVDGTLVVNRELVKIKQGGKIKWKFVPEMKGYKFYLSGKSSDGDDIFKG